MTIEDALGKTEKQRSTDPEITTIERASSLPPVERGLIDQRYRVLREIARGGMGMVVEAQHLYLGRSVALKMLLPEWGGSAEAGARLAREAAVLGLLEHPGIVTVQDAGVDRNGICYLAMEHLIGRTLEGLVLARGQLDGGSVARLGATVADTLVSIHQAGVVHRDIKPANIFLELNSTRGEQIKIIDFGIATTMPSATQLPGIGWHTTAGTLLGTPGYMPAEQILAQPVSDRNDVYALGATLYECLTGIPPHTGELTTVINQVLTGQPPPSLQQLRPDISPALVSAIEQALSREPGQRPSSAEFRALLRDCGGSAGSLLGEENDPNAPIPLVRRRVHPRYPFVTRVRVIQPDNTVLDGRCEEVSEGGLQLRLPVDLSLDGPIMLLVELPGKTVYLQGVPRWSRAQGPWRILGIQIAPDEHNDYPRFVQQLALQYRRPSSK